MVENVHLKIGSRFIIIWLVESNVRFVMSVKCTYQIVYLAVQVMDNGFSLERECPELNWKAKQTSLVKFA